MSDVNEARKAKLSTVPRRCKSVFVRAYSGRSRTAAIRANCLECVGYKASEVTLCTSLACPMYGYRPTFDAADVAEDLSEPKDPAKVEQGKRLAAISAERRGK